MADNETTTKLLTLLNVSATKSRRRRPILPTASPRKKLNKRASIQFLTVEDNGRTAPKAPEQDDQSEAQASAVHSTEEDRDVCEITAADPYEVHFGMSPTPLSSASIDAVNKDSWSPSRHNCGMLGEALFERPEGSSQTEMKDDAILDRVAAPLKARQAIQDQGQTTLQNDFLQALNGYNDFYYPSVTLDNHKTLRETLALHALNHITKKRRRVLKNNERLSAAAKADSSDTIPEDIQDQGFTRPSVLVLAPFRSSALSWVDALAAHTTAPAFQVENRGRFQSEYALPPSTIDKLATAEPGTYPRDHVETFKGNVDDEFRVGVKITKKSVKLFSEFYGSDIIFASPLGLRRSIDKEKNADFLSSIELLVIDQMDSLAMQNWEHLQFVLSNLNKLPKESRDTDFSRVKPWYLEDNAKYLRQSVFLSAYENPEMRSLYYNISKNVGGRIRTDRRHLAIDVPARIQQNFVQFDCTGPTDEAEKRFNYFTTQVLPSVMKSAVQSSNTVIFIPSSFDFIRVQNHFRKLTGITYSTLFDDTSNQNISRARQAFFGGKSSFLLVSERFHFYKRYKLRGIRNIIFYGPPDHAQFYAEFLSYPFLDEGVEPEDITCRVIFSRHDWFALQRIVGTDGARELLSAI